MKSPCFVLPGTNKAQYQYYAVFTGLGPFLHLQNFPGTYKQILKQEKVDQGNSSTIIAKSTYVNSLSSKTTAFKRYLHIYCKLDSRKSIKEVRKFCLFLRDKAGK